MWSREAAFKFTWEDVDNAGGVVYGIISVLYRNLLLCEVRGTNFQENSPGVFH